ncbi:class 1 alpha-mannosidase [Niveomyces insectorum RCEF 264]|uniref:alpha-1,2-Mannosidase n=1 Tax=Niveomyces insectorum RCEF 264 TaxID=1081102 RepID=A0A167X6J6_9HYPO|nr:class 1 alpha-mannosidase [Niveomyces insectorum RCEF 264]
MLGAPRRWRAFVLVAAFFVCAFWVLVRKDPAIIDRYRASAAFTPDPPPAKVPPPPPKPDGDNSPELRLTKLPDRYPVTSFKQLPTPAAGGDAANGVPPIQKRPAPSESADAREVRLARKAAVQASFDRSWRGYKENAWLADEVQPVSGQPRQDYEKLSGWASTLVDTLDTLWLMGLHDEFRMAVRTVCDSVDFGYTAADTVHLFETTIRYLGGLLGAYEISGHAFPELLSKATELGERLLGAFDTPNRLPLGRWDWRAYARGGMQTSAPHAMLSAELGTLSLEFTKLTQLTGDVRYYDAVQRIADVLAAHQQRTRLPGMWPVVVDAAKPAFDTDDQFTLNGKADSLFEYLPKQWLLLGGALAQPRDMYDKFLPVAKKHLFRRVLNAWNLPLVLPGDVRVRDDPLTGRTVEHSPRTEHLGCFTGGMVGLAARAFGGAHADADLDLAAQLTDGCVWSYNVTATGIGPEKFYYAACGAITDPPAGLRCSYSEDKWRTALQTHWKVKSEATDEASSLDHDAIDRLMTDGRLAPGMVDIDNPHYLLRPEAVESVFVMWRLTGDSAWQDKAWHMFQHIVRHTGAAPGSQPEQVAAAAVDDVTQADGGPPMDRMESFWLAETLKYFYLIFSDFDLLSLDEWVLNTEAHPLRRAGLSK